MSIPMVRILQKEISTLLNFPFLKIIYQAQKQSSNLFLKMDALIVHKTTLFMFFISLIGMELIKAYLVGMDQFNMAQFIFI
jgi:hypothetical protein